MGEQTVYWNCDGRRNINLCNILIRPYFPVHIRCVHKHNTHLCTPSWLRSRSFGKSCTTWGCTGMGQVFIFARDEVLEYCASQNATPITEAFSSVQVILEKTGTHFWCKLKLACYTSFVEHEFTLYGRREYNYLTPPPQHNLLRIRDVCGL